MTTTASATTLPRAFWTYWAGLGATALGDSAVAVALPFLALDAGGGAGAVGLVVLCGSLPRFLAPLLGGLADRLPARVLLALSAGGRAVAVGAVGGLALAGTAPLALLAALAFVNGLLSTLAYATGAALVPRLVAPALLPRANSLNSGALMGAPLVGYGVGGVLVHGFGAGGTLLVSAPLILGLLVAALALPHLKGAAGGRVQPLRDVLEGLRVIRRSPLLLALLAMSFALNLAMNVMNVRAPLHMTVFGRGAPDYAVFEMVIAGGVLAGIALVTPLAVRWRLDTLIGTGRWVLVLGTLGFTLTPVPAWWGAAAVFGLGLGLLEVAATTRSQQLVPDGLRGRVVGALMGVNAVGLTLGAALAAWRVETGTLMLALSTLLALLALTWTVAVRAQARRTAT
ncbi:MFS transporter [Deinococcus planocerae]|uniref:MFS transporter n=1 Tax=Deinococcus planocerae TaxID=1737569 RepID=UPI000C7EF417|nr:MFS transporter [Deinococcus planocerae]